MCMLMCVWHVCMRRRRKDIGRDNRGLGRLGLEKVEKLKLDFESLEYRDRSVTFFSDGVIGSLCPNACHKQLKEGKDYFGL